MQIAAAHEIFVVGDFHGDYEKAVKLLVGAGILKGIPANPLDAKWAAKKALLVCTGDMIDKWSNSVEVVQLMRSLQADAAKHGGQVIVTLGNHEAEFLASDGADDKSSEFAHELRQLGKSPQEVAAGRDADGIGAWLRDLPAAARVGDWFFCHAGNTHGSTVAQLETSIENGVNQNGFGAFVLAQPNSLLEARLHPVPWWMGPQGENTPEKVSKKEEKMTKRENNDSPAESAGPARLKQYIHALGCEHMVIGHQPGEVHFGDGIQRKAGEAFDYEGLLYIIDTGMSRGVDNGRGIVLKIHHGGKKENVTAVDDAGAQMPLADRN
jgi:hypothetical protein